MRFVTCLKSYFLLFFALIFIHQQSSAQTQVNLVSPPNQFVTIDTLATFNWSPIKNASSYEFQLSFDNLFASPLIDSSNLSVTSLYISGLDTFPYFWRVRAYVNSTPQAWSAFNEFKIISLPPINSLKLWWDASDSTTTDINGYLSHWGDKSGNNNYGVQSDPIQQPKKIDSVLNNHPVISFDGETQSIISNSFNYNQPITFFLVFNKKYNSGMDYICDGGGVNRFRLSVNAGNNYLFYAGNFFLPGNAGPIGYKVFSLRENGISSFVRNNFSHLGDGDSGPYSLNGFTLGTYGIPTLDNTVHAETDVAEVLIFNDTLSVAKMVDIENYLKFKYAPPVCLGKDSITTSFCPQTLSPQSNYVSYLWNTGETTKTISISTTGKYWLTTIDPFGFASTDTVNILYPSIQAMPDSSIICFKDTLTWNTGLDNANFTFLWQDATTTDSLFNITQNGNYYLTVNDLFGCNLRSDTLNVLVDVFSTVLSLGNDTSFCSGNQITLANGFTSGLTYLWTDTSNNDSLTIISSGQYDVTVTNGNSCIGKDTINVTIVGQAPLAAFEYSLACKNGAVTFNDTSIALGGSTITNWFWSFGDPNATNDTSIVQQPNYTFADTGSYSIHLTVTTNAGCQQSIIKNVHVFPIPSVSLGADTSLCAGNIITPVSSSGSGLTYLWSDSSVNDSIAINTSGQYWLTVTNSDNCTAKDTINVAIAGFAPTANFTNSLTCKNNVVTFTDNSSPPSGDIITNWHWNFGNTLTLADTSILQNTSYTYADTGNYVVNLSIETNVGCTQTFIKNIHVAPTPLVNFSNVIACKNDSASFVNSSSSINYTPLSYLWNFGDPFSLNNTSTLLNPYHSFSSQITYPVKLVVTNSAGCKDSLTKNISVKGQVSANFNYSTPCTNAPVVFQDNSIAPVPNAANIRTWSIGATTLTGLSISQSFPTPGPYTVKLTVNGFNGCNSSIIKTIVVKRPPIPQFAISPVCLNDTLEPIDQSVPQDSVLISWNWKLDNTTFSSSQNTSIVPLTSGSHAVRLTVSNGYGCKDSLSKSVNVFALPAVDFTTNPSSLYFINSPVTFTPTNTSGTLYNWTMDNNTYSTQTVSHSFDTIGIQIATLYMEDNNGCGNTVTKNLLIRDRILDLAILDVRTLFGNDGYITIEADLANYGTVPVSSFEIGCHVTNASSVKETWTGTPSSTSFFTYVFTSKIQQLQSDPNYITCVSIESVNGIADFDLNNNKLCVTSNLNNTSISDPFPNPTKDNLMLPIVLTKESDVSFEFIDLLGKVIGGTHIIQASTGLNLISIPTIELGNGQYFLKILIDDKTFIKKFTKLNQ